MDDPDSLDFHASCETFRRTLLYSSGDGTLHRLVTYSIASVFVPEPKRSHGYARNLMSSLHGALKQQKPTPAASYLLSDIGDYYARCVGEEGESWIQQSIRGLAVPLTSLPVDELEGVDLLGEVEIQPFIAQDGQLIEAEVKSATRPTMAIELTGLEVDWLIARTKVYMAAEEVPLPPAGAPTATYGARLRLAGGEELAYAIWSYDLPKQTLLILRWRARTKAQLRTLLAVARRAGEEQGCTELLAWNPPIELLDQELQSQVADMEDSWPCLAWYGRGSAPIWLNQEKYTWC